MASVAKYSALAGAWLVTMALAGHVTADPLPEPTEEQCISSFDGAQTDRDNGQLVEARSKLIMCAASSCPEPIARDCVKWLDAVRADIPSIVVVAKDPAGADTLAVRLLRGGQLLVSSVGVDAIELDPGQHVLRFELAGAEPIERNVVLRVGQKNERIDLTFVAPPEPAPIPAPVLPVVEPQPPPAPVPPTPLPDGPEDDGLGVMFWTGVIVAGAGLGVTAISGAIAISNKSDLDDRCPDDCTQQDIDDAAVPAHVATAGFAVASLGAAIAIIGLLVDLRGHDSASNTFTVRF